MAGWLDWWWGDWGRGDYIANLYDFPHICMYSVSHNCRWSCTAHDIAPATICTLGTARLTLRSGCESRRFVKESLLVVLLREVNSPRRKLRCLCQKSCFCSCYENLRVFETLWGSKYQPRLGKIIMIIRTSIIKTLQSFFCWKFGYYHAPPLHNEL